MKKIYHMKTCSTCRRILSELPNIEHYELQDVKKEPIQEADLDELHKRAGSYEALFSRKSTQYKERGLKDKSLTEQDYRNLILDHYTFLKRPVVVAGDHVFIGNDPKTTTAAKDFMANNG
ncbi:arsenate reductase family protein [Flavobacterium rhizosphaerae]|uniref:ArsC/Spx/MgsR family protein n=1 Tax=Flavobacterium rhizosphaerae TaxID=3163298 RepID=A0ABW8YYQ9_9FLAO